MKDIFKEKKNIGMIPVIFALGWPTMLEQLMQTAVQYVDTAMVGTLGTNATAAVGSTATINWLLSSTVSAFAIGFLAYISQSLGQGDERAARHASGQAVFLTLIVGTLFTLMPVLLARYVPVWMQVKGKSLPLAQTYFFIIYLPMLARSASIIFGTVLRASGDSKTPMWSGLIVNLTNVILNFLLIFPTTERQVFGFAFTTPGANLGVIGAAIATAVSYTVGGIIITVVLFRHKTVAPKMSDLKPDKKILSRCMKISLPNMLQRFCTSLGYVIFASMINSIGEIATAAHTIANTVESAFYIPGYGMQAAAATLTGNAIGKNDRDLLKRTSRSALVLEVFMMVVTGSLLFVFAPAMVSMFSKSREVIDLGAAVLRMVALSEPFYGCSIIIEGMMQGAGETKRPFIYSASCMWGVRILGTFIFVNCLGFGLVSAWGCMIANNLLLFILFLIYYIKGFNPIKNEA